MSFPIFGSASSRVGKLASNYNWSPVFRPLREIRQFLCLIKNKSQEFIEYRIAVERLLVAKLAVPDWRGVVNMRERFN